MRCAPLTIQACSLHFGADDFPFRIHVKRCFKIRNGLFSALAPRSGFGATISVGFARSSLVFCNSVSVDHSGVAT